MSSFEQSPFGSRLEGIYRRRVMVFWIAFAMGVAIAALLVPYTLNTWLAFAGKETQVTWWMGALVGLIPIPSWRLIIIFSAVITWIASLFIM